MALTRAKKNGKVAMMARELETSTSAIVGTFTGLTASKDFDLRKTVRGAGGNYHVVKNKLVAKSSQGTKVEQALQGLKGVSAVAYTSGDPVELAKALAAWVKDNSEFTFKLAIVDGKVLNVAEIGQLATMPGKEELFSKLLFLINSPAQRLATVINATGRNLAVVVNQAIEQNKLGGGAAPTAAEASPAAVEAAPAAVEAVPGTEATVVAKAHEEQAPTPTEAANEAATEQIAANPAAQADPVGTPDEQPSGSAQPSGAAQPENSTASQGGEAASTEPAEGA